MLSQLLALRGLTLSCLLTIVCAGSLPAQKNNALISDAEKKLIIEKVISLLDEYYIYPDVVDTMSAQLNSKFNDAYSAGLTTVESFLTTLNNDLETLSHDKHVNIFYDPIRVKQLKVESTPVADKHVFDQEFLKRAQYENFMVRKAERLDGNVGLLKMDMFVDIQISQPTLIAAMDFLSNSSALIIDLRQNGGGHASTVNFLINYFLPDSTLVCRFENRSANSTRLVYTEHNSLIKKFSEEIPVYILVSNRTSSAAEAFAYTLQAFKKAIIVGDTTKGEANPGYALPINDNMFLMVPTTFNRNEITKTNWQGIGVIPDISISPDKSVYAALSKIYEKLHSTSDDKDIKRFYNWMYVQNKSRAYPIKPDQSYLKLFVGEYEHDRKITLEGNCLYYERTGASDKKLLLPLTEDLFELENTPFFRVHFIKDETGNVVALEGLYDDGYSEISHLIHP